MTKLIEEWSGEIDTSVTTAFPTVNDDLPQFLLVVGAGAINADQVEIIKKISLTADM